MKKKRRFIMRKKILFLLLTLTLVLGFASIASAVSGRLSDWLNYYNGTYPAGAFTSSSCNVCHTSAPAVNSYGSALMAKGMTRNSLTSTMMVAVESSDSDGDGFTNIAEIRAGSLPGVVSSTPSIACTDYTYSAWSACGSNGQQTRTQIGTTPAGCTGTPPTQLVLTRACTPSPVACTDYTYSAWSACGSNGQQTRTQIGTTPAGCTGTPTTQPVLTQACTPPPTTGDTMPPEITSFELPATFNKLTVPILSFTATDDVGVVAYKITRTSSKPSASRKGWKGTPPTSVRFEETGVKTVYAWAKDAAGNVSLGAKAVVRVTARHRRYDVEGELSEPSGRQVYGSNLRIAPRRADDLSKMVPASLGAISDDGSSLELFVSIGKFQGAVDVYVSLYRPAFDGLTPMTLYNLTPAGVFEEVVDAVLPWKTNVTDVNESIAAGLPAAGLPAGAYILRFGVTPAGNTDNYYQWYTPFTIQ